MVDFGVNVVRSACKDKNLLALFFGSRNNLVALFNYLIPVILLLLVRFLCGNPHLVEREVGEMLGKSFISLLRKILGAVNTEVLVYEMHLADILHIILDNLGIVRNNGTIVVIVAKVLVKII